MHSASFLQDKLIVQIIMRKPVKASLVIDEQQADLFKMMQATFTDLRPKLLTFARHHVINLNVQTNSLAKATTGQVTGSVPCRE